jgi:hypothetical protein
MKLKFPKKIKIGDQYYLVEQDPKRNGGEFYSYDENKKKITAGKIIIGTKLLKVYPAHILCTIIHELKEIIQNDQYVRYQRPDASDSYEFHYTHREHAELCEILAGLLDEFIV